MTGQAQSNTTIGFMLRSLPPKHQVVMIDRLLGDTALPSSQRLPLQRLRSALMVELVDQARGATI